jgi:competence protein ComEA
VTALCALAAPEEPAATVPSTVGSKPLVTAERVDLNRASVTELMRLPGVGKTRARAILAARVRRPFRRLEDLLAVKGFSRPWLERQKGRVTVSDSAPASGIAVAPADGRSRRR